MLRNYWVKEILISAKTPNELFSQCNITWYHVSVLALLIKINKDFVKKKIGFSGCIKETVATSGEFILCEKKWIAFIVNKKTHLQIFVPFCKFHIESQENSIEW